VNAEDGLDELSTLGPTTVYEVNCGELKEWSLDPRSLGLRVPELGELQVDSIEESANAIKAIMAGEKGAKREIATLNAGAALVIAEKAKTLQEGIEAVNAAIDSGAAERTLAQLIDFL
jgi:anthranilate phosphoribosyltransferase